MGRTLLKFDVKLAIATTWANQVLRHLWTVFIGFVGTCLFSLRMQSPCCMLAGVSHIAPEIVYDIITFCVCNIHMFFVKNQKKRFLCALKSVDCLQTVPCNISSALFAACSLHAFYRKFCIFSAFLLVEWRILARVGFSLSTVSSSVMSFTTSCYDSTLAAVIHIRQGYLRLDPIL